MIAVGVDPGTHRLGYGVIQKQGTKYQVLEHGSLDLPARTKASDYLPTIFELVQKLLSKHHPNHLALETLLFQKNVKTAISVAEARGVIRLSAALSGIPVVELAPNTVKLVSTGYGASNKQAVARMIGLLLGENTAGLLDDEVDALAIAYASLS